MLYTKLCVLCRIVVFTAYVLRKNDKNHSKPSKLHTKKHINQAATFLYTYTKNLLIKQANTAEQKVAASEIITALKVFGFLHFEK